MDKLNIINCRKTKKGYITTNKLIKQNHKYIYTHNYKQLYANTNFWVPTKGQLSLQTQVSLRLGQRDCGQLLNLHYDPLEM